MLHAALPCRLPRPQTAGWDLTHYAKCKPYLESMNTCAKSWTMLLRDARCTPTSPSLVLLKSIVCIRNHEAWQIWPAGPAVQPCLVWKGMAFFDCLVCPTPCGGSQATVSVTSKPSTAGLPENQTFWVYKHYKFLKRGDAARTSRQWTMDENAHFVITSHLDNKTPHNFESSYLGLTEATPHWTFRKPNLVITPTVDPRRSLECTRSWWAPITRTSQVKQAGHFQLIG